MLERLTFYVTIYSLAFAQFTKGLCCCLSNLFSLQCHCGMIIIFPWPTVDMKVCTYAVLVCLLGAFSCIHIAFLS